MTTITRSIPQGTIQRQRQQARLKKRLLRILTIYIPVVIILAIMLLPFYWMFITSLKPYPEMFNLKISPFLTLNPTGEHYVELLTNTKFPIWFKNTVIVSVASTLISVTLSTLAGYSLSRLRYRGRSTLSGIIFISYLIPTTLLFFPLGEGAQQLQVFNRLHVL